MPFVRSLAFKHRALLILIIISLSEIMPLCFCYIKKKLLYITIAALSSHQPSFYFKCIKVNIRSLCNIHSISNAEYAFLSVLTV